jgi:hypothetical protein
MAQTCGELRLHDKQRQDNVCSHGEIEVNVALEMGSTVLPFQQEATAACVTVCQSLGARATLTPRQLHIF